MSSKRRSGLAGLLEDLAAPTDPKRRKRNDDTHFPDVETRDTTTEIGLRLVRQLKKSQDKYGRDVAIHFIDLPNRAEYPDYYQSIAMPLSLNMIEQRLENSEYETLEQLESDLKRMVQNAKDYNHSKSPIFEDAERIRKALSNFMPKYNPAYLRSEYRAYPTPIPQELLDQARQQSASSEPTAPEKVKLVFSNTAARRRQSEAAPSTPGDAKDDENEDAKEDQLSFLKELSEQDDAINFEEKVPKKDYPDYYKLIKKPTSISDVRVWLESEPAQDWDSLAREVRLIWDNAKEYNQEGSDIYMMAEKLESWSETRMQQLGAQPKKNLKLSLSQPKPKALRLTLSSTTPTPTVVGGTIDSESLRRQKEEMGAALSRVQTTNSSAIRANGSTPRPVSVAPSVRRSTSLATEQTDVAAAAAGATAAVADVNGASTPQPGADTITLNQNPVVVERPSAVQDVAFIDETPLTNGTAPPEPPAVPAAPKVPFNQSIVPMERHFRDPEIAYDDTLLGSVTYMTNPDMPHDPKWKLNRFAQRAKTQVTGLVALPYNYRHIRVIPNFTPELGSRRRHKIFFVHNMQTYREPNSREVPGAYDVTLTPGQNILTVEVLADLKSGITLDYAPPQLQFDFEKNTMLVELGTQSAS